MTEDDQLIALRDYFAGQALVGLLADPELSETIIADAYRIADAMLAEREKGKQQ